MAYYGTTWRPLTWSVWTGNAEARSNISFATAWSLTHEILKDHTSHCWAAISQWAYVPSGAEIAMWDKFELEGKLKRKYWRPWVAGKDPFAAGVVETREQQAQRLARRERIQRTFHFQ